MFDIDVIGFGREPGSSTRRPPRRHPVAGTTFRQDRQRLDTLKLQIA